MHCREAKRRLTQHEAAGTSPRDDAGLAAHISSCPDCAARAEAQAQLHRALACEREHAEPVLDQATLRSAVEARVAQSQSPIRKGTIKMANLWNPLSGRLRWSIGIAAAVTAVALITLIPFSYQQTVGYEVAFAGVDPTLAMDQYKIQVMLTKLGVGDANVEVGDCEAACKVRIGELKTPEDCELVVCAFGNMANVEILDEGTAVREHKRGRLVQLVGERSGEGDVVLFSNGENKLIVENLVIERLGADFARECNIFITEDCNGQFGTLADAEGNVTIDVMMAGLEDCKIGDSCVVLCSLPDGSTCEAIVGCAPGGKQCAVDQKGCATNQIGSSNAELEAMLKEYGTSLEELRTKPDPEVLAKLREAGIIVKFKDWQHSSAQGEFGEQHGGETNDWVTDGESAAKAGITPEGYELAQNFPNPFNPSTTIEYTLAAAGPVRIEVINVMGRTVRTLVDASRSAGTHSVQWDGKDDLGIPVPSGTYLYSIQAEDFRETRSMTLLK